MFGELIPVGGGDTIPLLKKTLLVGRRESCDIVLRFANVSAHHCQLTIADGYWFVKDMNSRNGIKVNGVRVQEKRIDPGDTLTVAKHKYIVQYSPAENGAMGPPPADVVETNIFGRSLLDRAGLQKTQITSSRERSDALEESRYDLDDPSSGPMKRRRGIDPL